MNNSILVTGATGNVGRWVVKALRDRGENVIGTVHSAPQKTLDRDQGYRYFDFGNTASWGDCCKGVDRVFLIRPPHISRVEETMVPFLQFLEERGIRHLVFLSVQGAESRTRIPHHKLEAAILKSKIPYTLLRPSFFMQNLTTTHLPEIRDESRLYIPAGEGRTNFIDTRDIGEIAAAVFSEPEHIGQAYTITGAKSFSYREVCHALSRGIGRPIRYADPGLIPFLSYQLLRGRRPMMTLVMFLLYRQVKRGEADITTSVSERLLGKEPRSLDGFIAEHRDLFMAASR